jgi:hypothetical protein
MGWADCLALQRYFEAFGKLVEADALAVEFLEPSFAVRFLCLGVLALVVGDDAADVRESAQEFFSWRRVKLRFDDQL